MFSSSPPQALKVLQVLKVLRAFEMVEQKGTALELAPSTCSCRSSAFDSALNAMALLASLNSGCLSGIPRLSWAASLQPRALRSTRLCFLSALASQRWPLAAVLLFCSSKPGDALARALEAV